jgi:hypothetical protein
MHTIRAELLGNFQAFRRARLDAQPAPFAFLNVDDDVASARHDYLVNGGAVR